MCMNIRNLQPRRYLSNLKRASLPFPKLLFRHSISLPSFASIYLKYGSSIALYQSENTVKSKWTLKIVHLINVKRYKERYIDVLGILTRDICDY